MRGTRITAAVAGGLLLVTAGACGSGSKSTDEAKSVATTVASAVAAARTAEASRAPAASGGAAPAATTAVATAAAAAVQAFDVKAADFSYDPKELTVKPGSVRITMNNASSARPHTIAVKTKSGDGNLVKSGEIAVGQSGTIEFTVADEGTYEIYCTLPGHADRGQKGTLTVKRS